MYITYSDYTSLYGTERLSETDFARVGKRACRAVDIITTGIDNYKKLQEAFPEDENDIDAVKTCICSIMDLFYQVGQAAPTVTSNGLSGGVIASMSAGNESISYATSTISQAAGSTEELNKLIRETVKEGLSGITDANGINLLYMGPYPEVESDV